jgi:rubrerythrin
MIGKQDWLEMAEQIRLLEEKMASNFKRLAEKVEDPWLRSKLTALYHEEKKHMGAVERMKRLIDRG